MQFDLLILSNENEDVSVPASRRILNSIREGLVGHWRVTTAKERVELADRFGGSV